MPNNIKSTFKKVISSRTLTMAAYVAFLMSPLLLVPLAMLFPFSVGDPGGVSDSSGLSDVGDECAWAILRVITAVSTIPSSLIGWQIAFSEWSNGKSAMNVVKGLGIAIGGPALCHFMGTFTIDNISIGGLGSE